MKKLFFLAMLAVSGLWNAQYLIDDFDDSQFLGENGKTMMQVNLNMPMEHFRIRNCAGLLQYAQPRNGESALKEELFSNMVTFLDRDNYALNGRFFVEITVNANGKISGFDLKPKVVNGEMLHDDMKFIVNRLKTEWVPAKCGSTAIDSKVRLTVDFRTDIVDM